VNGYFDYLERSPRLRRALFGALLLLIVGCPLAHQIFLVDSPWLHGWTMFHRVGEGVYAVEFFEQADAGLQPIRWPPPERPPHTIQHVLPPPSRLLNSSKLLHSVVQRLCSEADQPQRLRARIRRAGMNEWTLERDVDQPLCGESFDVE
jgi:hypothetical protein